MYPSYNASKAIHEARLRELHEAVQLQGAEQVLYAGLLARLRGCAGGWRRGANDGKRLLSLSVLREFRNP